MKKDKETKNLEADWEIVKQNVHNVLERYHHYNGLPYNYNRSKWVPPEAFGNVKEHLYNFGYDLKKETELRHREEIYQLDLKISKQRRNFRRKIIILTTLNISFLIFVSILCIRALINNI